MQFTAPAVKRYSLKRQSCQLGLRKERKERRSRAKSTGENVNRRQKVEKVNYHALLYGESQEFEPKLFYSRA